jgi:hypothetical protein
METAENQVPIRDRIKDLNAKSYYLLVALSFLYRASSSSHLLKWALSLVAVAAVLPVQDYVESKSGLEILRALKVTTITVALVCVLFWIWTATAPAAPAN